MKPLTKEEYEKRINAAPVLRLDPNRDPELYKTERYKLLELLWEYYSACIYSGKDYGENTYDLALVETADDCLKNYDPETGPFLHYFVRSMSRKMRAEQAREHQAMTRNGIRIPDKTLKRMLTIRKYAESKNLNLNDPAVLEKIAQTFKTTPEKLRALLRAEEQSRAVPDVWISEDGEEVSIIETIVADRTESAEEKILREESLKTRVGDIRRVFDRTQERQKKLLSMLITAEVLRSFQGDMAAGESLLAGYPFFSSEILQLTISAGEVPTNKKIGEMNQISEQSLSRTYRFFKEKIKEEIAKSRQEESNIRPE